MRNARDPIALGREITMTIGKRRQPRLSRPLNLAALGTLTLGLAILCAPVTASAADTVLYPGDSIQDAVDAASPGDKIILMPGEYYGSEDAEEAVRIKKDFIRLIGKPDGENKVILRPNPDGSNEDGILVEPDGGDPIIQGSVIQGITVEGFPGNGIKVELVNNFQILDNESINNLENGIQPELSANGLVKNNLSYGSLDSAMWIEGGTNVRVIGNVLHSSVDRPRSHDLQGSGHRGQRNVRQHGRDGPLPPVGCFRAPVAGDRGLEGHEQLHPRQQPAVRGRQVVCPPSSRPVGE